MIKELKKRSGFNENCKFLIFDFNGEYAKENCITSDKKVYYLSTGDSSKDKIPMTFNELMAIETLAILLEATEKTQKPFLKRTLKYYKTVKESTDDSGNSDFVEYFKNIIKRDIKNVLQMTNKDTALKILDYLEEIFAFFINEEAEKKLREDIQFHAKNMNFFKIGTAENYQITDIEIGSTNLFKAVDNITADSLNALSELNQFFIFLLLQLINDLYRYKVQFDHIIPVINRFKAKQKSIENTFKIDSSANLWSDQNVVVINLRDVNLDMRKTIPLLLAKNIFNAHKRENNKKSLSIIIDEAHNILSKTSFRETEDWKDYRLETFEEIIKEGRKFGVFVTIASQRPNDISETIISQAHNYFIHQLINQRDLQTIGNAVSYIDKITEESIPTLSIGTCIFSGIATPMPLKIKINELPDDQKPDSHTLQFENITETNL